ncbi:hypothetical protein LCGC14_2852570 [marine sediment metagenome]|uniref:Uncharacterized protein n=1 Tax=marine sediment metagenome TaxID=412755 RepID=A0A0F8YUU0_9ZZZZ
MDIAAAKARYEAAMAAHRELEAIPKSVCLGCGALESWPCDAVGLAADSAIALEALEEAQGKLERIERLTYDLHQRSGHPDSACLRCQFYRILRGTKEDE